MLTKRGKDVQQQYTERSASQNNRTTPKVSNRQMAASQSSALSTSQMQTPASVSSNFQVVIRVRPPLQRERSHGVFRPVVQVSPDNKSVAIMEYLGQEVDERERALDIDANPHLCVWQSFSFDFVYEPQATQEFVYDNTARTATQSILEGYNATVLAYGQTGTGKTHTMEGFKYTGSDPARGIVPRSMEEIFSFI